MKKKPGKGMKKIYHNTQLEILAAPAQVFEIIYSMPKKFPVYPILESRPFLFVRLLLVGGFRTALEGAVRGLPHEHLVLHIGDSMGPFTLTECAKPRTYMFTLRSFFFNCKTGYTLEEGDGKTIMNFKLVAENPSPGERAWWFFVKPVHVLLARKVLTNIKMMAEIGQDSIK